MSEVAQAPHSSPDGHIPQLRFPEFSGAWEEKKLGDIGSFKGGGTPSKSVDEYWEGDIPWISSSDISEQDIHNIKISRFINEISIKESATKIIPKESVLFVSRVGVGKLAINKKEICTSQDFTSLLPKDNSSYFLGYFFLAKNNLLIRYSQGTSIKGFTKNDIETLKLNIPTKLEQQKIAAFLTAVDNKIEQLSKKQALLGGYKKGLMQKIFSQAIRFKADDGSELPDWEEKKLDDVGSFKSGTGFTEAEQGGKSGVPFFKVSDMNLEGNQKVMVSANNYVNDEQIARLNYKPINKKSVIFAKVGAAVFLERKRIADSFLIDNNMMAFTPTEDIDFIRQWFDTVRLSKYAQVGALPSYNASDLKTIKINLSSLPEQTKIANFLSSIDNKIEQVGKQLDESKQFKKALLQQMFV